jgi:hypothetical protein
MALEKSCLDKGNFPILAFIFLAATINHWLTFLEI